MTCGMEIKADGAVTLGRILWQCDLKLVGPRWLITILDDHSRYVTGNHIFKDGTAENAIRRSVNTRSHERSSPITDRNSGAYAEENPASTGTASTRGSNISSPASASPQRLERLNDGSEPTTSSIRDSSSPTISLYLVNSTIAWLICNLIVVLVCIIFPWRRKDLFETTVPAR